MGRRVSGVCGIYAPRDPSLAAPELLERMAQAIGHRGPVLRRTFVDHRAGIALVHLHAPEFTPAGASPVPHWHEAADLVATLDGAIFGDDARAEDSPPNGSPDVARAAAAFRASAAAFPAGLTGPFALALWSRAERALYLAREALGTRPLYVAYDAARALTVFASELQGVIAHPAIDRRVDPRALSAYLTFGYVPAPLTMIAGVEKVFPGDVLRIGADGALVRRAFWSHPPFDTATDDVEALAAATREQVMASVARHVGGAGHVGVYLSGGVDSTLVLCALRLMGVPVRETFTLGVRSDSGESRFTEDLGWAEPVARAFGTSHHPILVGADEDSRAALSRLLRHMGEPLVTPNVYAKYFLAQAAHDAGIDSCLSGSGCGMIFQRYSAERLAKFRARAGENPSDVEIYLAARNRFVPCDEQRDLLATTEVDPRATALEIIRRYRAGIESDDLSDVIHTTIVRFQGPEKSLAAQERAAVLNGVWLRHPFHDADLLRFANTIPARLKGSESRGLLKVVLKRAFADVLPQDVADRPRMGPPSYYFRKGEIDPLVRSLLSPAAVRRAGLLREDAVARLLEEELTSDRKSAGKHTWGLLALHAWHALHVEHDDSFLESFETTAPAAR
jgi:asparagine synthase (glutamine-hydrolysing)